MAEAVRPQRRAKAKASRTKTKVRIPCHPPKTQETVLSPLSSLGPQQQLYASPESSAYSAHTAQDLIPPSLDTRTVSLFSSPPCQTLSGARIFFFLLRSFRALPFLLDFTPLGLDSRREALPFPASSLLRPFFSFITWEHFSPSRASEERRPLLQAENVSLGRAFWIARKQTIVMCLFAFKIQW